MGLSARAERSAPSPSRAAAAERPAAPRNVRRSMVVTRYPSFVLGERGRRHESLELALEQPREGERRQVTVLRTDDLHADRKPGRREPARGSRRRQVRHARVARPEQVIRHRETLAVDRHRARSEEHTSELQSLAYLVCRLLLEKKKKNKTTHRARNCCS